MLVLKTNDGSQRGILVGAWHQRDAQFCCKRPRACLVTKDGKLGRCWSDKVDARVITGFGEVRVFAEEPVTRVNRIGGTGFGRVDDFFDVQVRLCASAWNLD